MQFIINNLDHMPTNWGNPWASIIDTEEVLEMRIPLVRNF